MFVLRLLTNIINQTSANPTDNQLRSRCWCVGRSKINYLLIICSFPEFEPMLPRCKRSQAIWKILILPGWPALHTICPTTERDIRDVCSYWSCYSTFILNTRSLGHNITEKQQIKSKRSASIRRLIPVNVKVEWQITSIVISTIHKCYLTHNVMNIWMSKSK